MASEPNEILLSYLLKQTELQQQLIEAQQEIIRLQKKLEAMTPPTPEDDVHFHLISGGVTSEEVVASGDLQKLRTLNDWVFAFGNKYIKPYVHLKAYGELMAQMTRGFARQLAELEINALFEDEKTPKKKGKSKETTKT